MIQQNLANPLIRRALLWGFIGASAVVLFEAVFGLSFTSSWAKMVGVHALAGTAVGGLFGCLVHFLHK